MSSKPRGISTGKMFLLGIVVLAMLVVLQQTAILVMAGMLPSIVAYLVDISPRRSLFKTVFCFNLVGVLPEAARLYFDLDNTGEALQQKLFSPITWFRMYMAAALGWLITWAGPYIARILLLIVYDQRLTRLRGIQERLEHEWGNNIGEYELKKVGKG